MLHIREVSDLHLEMYYDLYDRGMDHAKNELTRLIPPLPTDKKTVLIVAGDLATARRPQRIRTFFEILKPRFKHFIYVLGNHEHYGVHYNETFDIIANCLADSPILDLKKITMAGNEPIKVVIGKVTFLLGTLWTDYATNRPIDTMVEDVKAFRDSLAAQINQRRIEKPDADLTPGLALLDALDSATPVGATQIIVSRYITDHKVIKNESGDGIPPAGMLESHNATVAEFGKWMEGLDNSKTVVVTHHLPTFSAVAPQYTKDATTRVLNHAFASNLDAFILKHQPAVWFFGHTHIKYNGQIGNTKLHCNPLGYPNEPTVGSGTYDSTQVYSL